MAFDGCLLRFHGRVGNQKCNFIFFFFFAVPNVSLTVRAVRVGEIPPASLYDLKLLVVA